MVARSDTTHTSSAPTASKRVKKSSITRSPGCSSCRTVSECRDTSGRELQTLRGCGELLSNIGHSSFAIRGELPGFLCQPCGSNLDICILVRLGADGKLRRVCGRYRVRVTCNMTATNDAHMGDLPSDKPSCCISGEVLHVWNSVRRQRYT